ncbi:MAG TPA: BTAD domain-containing putative transcriptional regulator [Gemmatimonadaceae bacterium]|nr:BTAD domain-containing putative transcriptional regulator [Gemmatimonadaceae bacterium]
MIDVRALGGAKLTRADGVEVRSLLAQPKRFALLAYLVLASPRGFHRRDSLLLRFWPESDEERARASLRTGLSFLRRALGAGVVETRGVDEVRIAPGAVACDVLAFEAAVAAGRLEAALDLYRGPLLPGLSVADAPGWDEWLDAERARLTRLASRAAWTLAERAEAAGDPAGATGWAHRALALTPDEEEAVRRFMALLGRVGDRATALRAYEGFAARLAREYDAAPSAQTRAVADAMRVPAADAEAGPATSRPVTPPPTPGPVPLAGEPALAPERAPELAPDTGAPERDSVLPPAPPSAARAAARRTRTRRWGAGALAALAVVTLLGALRVGHAIGPEPAAASAAASAAADAGRIAVLPFAVRGQPRYAYLGEGMVDLLSATLDGAGELRAVDPRAVLGATRDGDHDGAAVEPAEASRIADRLAARYYVLGAVVAGAERLQVSASLYDRLRGREPVIVARAEGEAGDPFQLVDALTARLLAGRLGGPGRRLDRIATQTTRSLPALKLYLQGKQALRAGRFDAAVDLFAQALREDSTFALAAYGLSVAGDVAGRAPLFPDPMPLALRHADRLSSHDALLLEARAVAMAGQSAEAIRLYRRVLATHPDDVEAWYQLGDVLFHGTASDVDALARARASFERVLFYEPEHEEALQHLARIAAAAGDRAAVDSLTARVLARSTGDIALEMAALRALALDDAAARARLLDRLARTPDNRVWLTVWRAALATENFADARALLAPLTEAVRPAEVRADGHVGLGYLELAAGRPAAAARELDRADALRPGISLVHRVLLAPFPFLTGRCDSPERLRQLLRQAPGVPPRPAILAAAAWARWSDSTPSWRSHLEALLAACGGDGAEALAIGSTLPSATAIRAAVAWAGGPVTPAEVLDAGAAAGGSARQRFVRAELLRRVGRADDALRLYRALRPGAEYGAAPLLAPAHLRRAELFEARGESVLAAAEYRRVARLWREAEPPLRAVAARAARRAGELEGR